MLINSSKLVTPLELRMRLSLMVAARSSTTPAMSFEEYVIQPAAHAQKNLPQQRKLMKMLGVNGGFAFRTERHLVSGRVIDECKSDQSPVAGHVSPLTSVPVA